MILRVIVDNNSLIDEYYLAEPALCFYLEDNNHKILFDLGYSDVFLKNLKKMNIDINKIDTIVFSHGHNDHTGGLKYLSDLKQNIDIYCHKLIDQIRYYKGFKITSDYLVKDLPNNFKVHYSNDLIQISDNLYFLGEIKRNIQIVNKLENDEIIDDSALVYKTLNGLYIISGCAHSGIINIIEQAKSFFNLNVISIIGGFHLLNDEKQSEEIGKYLKENKIKIIYPCHCTDLKAKIILSKYVELKDVGVNFIQQF